MARATKKTENRQASAEDKEQLKRIARKMLNRLERSVDRIDETEEAQAHDKLFGAKNSLVAALVTLSDLMADLGDIEPEQAEEIVEDKVKKEEEVGKERVWTIEEVEKEIGEENVAFIKDYIAREKAKEEAWLNSNIHTNSIPPPEIAIERGGDP